MPRLRIRGFGGTGLLLKLSVRTNVRHEMAHSNWLRSESVQYHLCGQEKKKLQSMLAMSQTELGIARASGNDDDIATLLAARMDIAIQFLGVHIVTSYTDGQETPTQTVSRRNYATEVLSHVNAW
jgi:hypothetical protein